MTMAKFSAEEKLVEIEREVQMRKRVYDRQVGYKKMSREEADRKIAIMREIALDYARIAAGLRPPLGISEHDVAKAIYESDPAVDSGEAIDGFQVTPAGPISWSAIVETDQEGPWLKQARAVLALLAPKSV